MSGRRALDAPEFARAMDRLGPFEAAPELALAVSGGRDSMALALLAADWAGRRGGRVVALTVDHRLRADSAAEARQVHRWLSHHGIPHRTLVWQGDKPASGVQAAARAARYRLLTGWCRRHGVLHLALAHQQEDQAETLLMRRARDSGPDGLAAMPAWRCQDGVRLLRPLLTVPRARLAATLTARGQAWIDDPSNADPAFERTRTGRKLERLAKIGIDARRLAADSQAAGAERAALDHAVAALAAEAVSLSPAGFALVSPAPLAAAPAALRQALLARLVRTVGGGTYLPAQAALARLDAAFLATGEGLGRTLGGCRLAPWHGRLLIARESRHPAPPTALTAGETVPWDRFLCRRAGGGRAQVAMLGAEGWRRIRAAVAAEAAAAVPAIARPTLPALRDRRGILAVPHLGYLRPAADDAGFHAVFRPSQALTAPPFAVVSPAGGTM